MSWAAAVMCNSVQDRVEASPEQLASAMAAGEKLSEESGMRVRVIGWYHSHPHITVLPFTPASMCMQKKSTVRCQLPAGL